MHYQVPRKKFSYFWQILCLRTFYEGQIYNIETVYKAEIFGTQFDLREGNYFVSPRIKTEHLLRTIKSKRAETAHFFKRVLL